MKVFVKCPECTAITKHEEWELMTETRRCGSCGHQITYKEREIISTRYTDTLRCPHCACDIGNGESYEDYGGEAVTCDSCQRPFNVLVETSTSTVNGGVVDKTVEYTSEIDCELEDDLHEWKPSKSITFTTHNYYNCANCDQSLRVSKEIDETEVAEEMSEQPMLDLPL